MNLNPWQQGERRTVPSDKTLLWCQPPPGRLSFLPELNSLESCERRRFRLNQTAELPLNHSANALRTVCLCVCGWQVISAFCIMHGSGIVWLLTPDWFPNRCTCCFVFVLCPCFFLQLKWKGMTHLTPDSFSGRLTLNSLFLPPSSLHMAQEPGWAFCHAVSVKGVELEGGSWI